MRRWRVLGPLCASTFVLGCATEPSAAVLSGQWGGSNTEFIATVKSAELRLACNARARFRGPIVLDAAGRFQLRGTLRQRYSDDLVQVDGVVKGSDLTVVVVASYSAGGGAITQSILRAGATPDFSQAVCLA